MNHSVLASTKKLSTLAQCVASVVSLFFVGLSDAQQRLSGVPSADDIARALSRPANDADANMPAIRTRGLMIDKTASTETVAVEKEGARAATPSSNRNIASMAPAPAAARAIDLEIQFAFGSDRLTQDGRAVLDQLGAALRSEALADVTGIVLEGHTDAVGSAQSNRVLSLRRAQSAQTYLAERHSIKQSAISAIGKGATELADPSNPTDGINRRVRVIVKS